MTPDVEQDIKDVMGIEGDHFMEVFSTILQDPITYHQTVLRKYLDKEHTDDKLCSECKGRCCKKAPCHYSPDDFRKITFTGLDKIIRKGEISIVRVWTGEYNAKDEMIMGYILRPRGVGRPISDHAEKTDIVCGMLTEKGCKLSYEKRPMGGKLLIPKPNNQCYNMYEGDWCVRDWEPYYPILHRLFVKYRMLRKYT